MEQPPVAPTISRGTRWFNFAVLIFAAAIIGLFLPLYQNQYGHRIMALGLVVLSVVMFRNPIRLTDKFTIQVRGTLDRTLVILALAFLVAGVVARYAHDL